MDLNHASITLWPAFLSPEEGWALMQHLNTAYSWEQPAITLFGKTHKIPRKAAWIGPPNTGYAYAGIQHRIQPWSKELLRVKERIEALTHQRFNSVLLNAYANGEDKMGWHSDNEPALGPNPVIASLNVGATRRFDVRHKENKSDMLKIPLRHGSLLLMDASVQNHYVHQVPQQKRVDGKRINLTFRHIITY